MRLVACAALGALLVRAALAADDPLDRAAANPTSTGLLIVEVVADSQAAAAGLLEGDILTSYNGKAVASTDDLKAAMTDASVPDRVKLQLDRAGKATEALVARGQMGIRLAPVRKGERFDPLPPATDVTFEWSRIEKQGDAWYAFSLDGTKKAGFEHYAWGAKEGTATLEGEIAFDAGAEGISHFVVSEEVTLAARPRGVKSEMSSPLAKWTQAWKADAGQEVVPQYFAYALARCMPQKKGACLHFTAVDESNGRAGRPSALCVVAQESIRVGEKGVPTWRIEWTSMGQVLSTQWVDTEGNVVQMDYGGEVGRLASKEEALRDLNPEIHPQGTK